MNIEKIAQDLDFDIEDLQMLLEVFLQTAKESLVQLHSAFENSEYEAMRSAAHSIKGSAANLLLDDLSKNALMIEKSAKNKETIDYQQYIQNIENSIVKLERLL